MLRIPVLTLLAALTSGCYFDAGADDDYDFYGAGTLVVDWTVAGSKSRLACRDFGADSIDIIIATRSGDFVDEFTVYCERFSAAVDLVPGRYVVDSVLLDFDGYELTTPVRDGLRIYDLETTVSAIDFPEDSFF